MTITELMIALNILTNSSESSNENHYNIELSVLPSPILFRGNEKQAFRDPAAIFNDGTFYLYYTYVETEDDGKIYSYTAYNKSKDLVNWTKRRIITPKDQLLNFCSPGNIIRFDDEWILCVQTYPRPDYTVDQAPRYGDKTARLYIMRSKDLENWSKPELLKVKGPDVPVEEMGRMIDPYLIEDKDEPGKWWCFYKQNGISISYSYNLEEWTYFGRINAGENPCIIVKDDKYVLFHSPGNGIGIKESVDLKNWQDVGGLITLGQKDWLWAKGRLTAGFVLDMTDIPKIGKYIMFFHGSGPQTERVNFDRNASIGIAWSQDLLNWEWQ